MARRRIQYPNDDDDERGTTDGCIFSSANFPCHRAVYDIMLHDVQIFHGEGDEAALKEEEFSKLFPAVSQSHSRSPWKSRRDVKQSCCIRVN